jgi:HEAT repeat protein
LRQALRRSPGDASRTAEVLELLSKANVRGQMIVPALTSSDVHALLDVYPDLSVEAQAGMQQLLASLTLDPVARLRTARLLREPAPDKVPSALMRSSMTTVSSALALQLTAWPDREVQVAAERALLLGDRIEVGAWPQRDAVALLSRLVNERSFELGFEWSRQNGQLPELVRAIHRTHGASVALAQAQRWVDARPELLRVILPELLRLGPAADEVLERFARSTGIELQLRELVIGELGRRSSSGSARALLRELLGDEHADLRAHAARELLKYADQGDREQVLAAWLKGSFREQFSIQLNHADLPVVESALESTQGPARLRLVRLVEHLDDPRQVPLLVDLWKTGDREVREKCRDALRAIDAQRVLPFLQSDLDDGVSASILEVVGPLRSIPEQLVGKCSVATDKATWVRFFERVTGDGVLHAPGLFDVLSLLLREQQGGPAAIRLFVRLDEWSQANKVQELAAAMEPALAGSNRNELLGYIVEATAQLGAAHRARVLASVGRPTDHAIVMALLDVVLASPFVREALSPAMAAAVERELATALDGEPERARRILSHRAGHAVTETERTALVGTLERSLRHPSPRVRLHAHRLLRTHADRPTYLAATRLLLDDRDSTTVRSAIRVLAFGHAIEAVPEMCDLLFHSHAAVRRAARDGLVVLGEDAVSTLTRAIGRARPDQRQALTEVLDEVRQGRGEGEAERGDEGEYVRSWRRS